MRIERDGLSEIGERATGVNGELVGLLVNHADEEVSGVFGFGL